MSRYQSLEYLENDYWEKPAPEATGLVRRCHEYRKIPIGELTTEQLRTLAGQKLGLNFILELIIEKLEADLLLEANLYRGDLLMTTKMVPAEFWKINLFERFASLVRTNAARIEAELGDKELYLLYDRLDVLHGFLKK